MSPNSFHESNAHRQVQTTAARSIFQARLHSSKSFKMSGRAGPEIWRRMAARQYPCRTLRSAQTAYDAKKTKAPGRVGRAINYAMDVAISPLQIRWLSQPNLRQCRRMHRFGGDELQHTSQYLPTTMVQEFRVVDQSQKNAKGSCTEQMQEQPEPQPKRF